MDFKAFIEAFVQDLLAVQELPEWPAAMALVKRLVAQLNTEKARECEHAFEVPACAAVSV